MSDTMTKDTVEKKIHDLVKGEKIAALATISEGKPWVRYVMARSLDESLTLYASTSLRSRKIAQIKANPKVHLTLGVGPDNPMGPYIQFDGTAHILTDQKTKDAMWEDYLKRIFTGTTDPDYVVLKLIPEKIELWGATEEMFKPLIWTA